MSIEVTAAGFDRPYIFGALLGRDEVFDNILSYGIKANLTWAIEDKDRERDKKEEEKEVGQGAVLAPTTHPGSPRSSPGRTMRMSEIKDLEDDVDDLIFKTSSNML